MLPKTVQTTLAFIEKINQGDVEGVIAMLAPESVYVDLEGNLERGKEQLADYWRRYLKGHPDYQIYIHRIFTIKNGVVLVGRTTGSHLKFPDEVEFQEQGLIWLV